MGYRNRIEGKLVRQGGGMASVDIGGAVIEGRARGEIKGDRAVAAMRPDDLTPMADANRGIAATVESIEYRGREFHGLASTPQGAELHFSSPVRLEAGAPVRLAAEPRQVLIFAADDA
jgi:putative spermidine/putrescine transport system ATP-binding protein